MWPRSDPTPLHAVRCSSLEPWARALARTPLPAAIGITGQVTTGLLLIGAEPSPSVLSMVLAVAVSSYAVDHIIDERALGRRAGHGRVAIAALGLWWLGASLAHRAGGMAAATTALLFPLSVLAYAMPWLAGMGWLRRRGIRRLKDVPWVKNAYTAGCVTGSTLWAAGMLGVYQTGSLLCPALLMWSYALINTTACDLGDVALDRAEGVPTLAVRFGRSTASRMLMVASFTWMLAMLVACALQIVTSVGVVAVLACMATIVYLRRLGSRVDVEVEADLVPDLTDGLVAITALGLHSSLVC